MDPLTTLLMALGLSTDAFAASIADGARHETFRLERALQLALTFGLFQGAMPLIGWTLGRAFAEPIKAVDHWVAFALLGFIGARMIYADLRSDEDADVRSLTADRGWRTVLLLGVATSIDALAVGFGLTFLGSILFPVVIIGIVTFAMCLAGVQLGHRYRRFTRGKVQAVGGVILIGIGTKILLEHLGVLA